MECEHLSLEEKEQIVKHARVPMVLFYKPVPRPNNFSTGAKIIRKRFYINKGAYGPRLGNL